MIAEKANILIIEDDQDIAEMLNAYFRVQGYDAQTAYSGKEGLQSCFTAPPDLIILDIRMPDIDGYEVARQLRSNQRTKQIPIIFLTEKRQRADRLRGLELGADDYITKPFDIQELRLRVRNSLRRSDQGNLTNPVTNMPERDLVDERLRECLVDRTWAFLVVSIFHIDSFREAYGFVSSDDVLRAISQMIRNSVQVMGSPEDFVGHLGDTQFIIVTRPETLDGLSTRIQTRLDQSLTYFYPVKDRQKGLLPGLRLKVEIGRLIPDDEHYQSLDYLKTMLLRSTH